MPYTYDYPHMAVTVDAVVFMRSAPAKVLLIKRAKAPFKDAWAAPGGFVDMDETMHAAALRELEEETGLTGVALRFLNYFDAPNRDPRERTISIAFWGVADEANANIKAADDASDAAWHDIDNLPELAFDHAEVLKQAIRAFRRRRK